MPAAPSDLSFLRLAPSPDLLEHVESFWFMRGSGPAALPDGHRILPDGCMEFVFQLGDPFEQRHKDGHFRLQESLLLVGQMECRVDVRPSGVIHTVGIHFRPAGMAAFVGGDLRRFAGCITPLQAALERDLSPVVARLKNARSPRERGRVLEAFLRTHRLPGDPAMAQAAAKLSSSFGPVDFEALASEFSLSERQFRRRFEKSVGIGPKVFSRLIRFQRIFEQRLEREGRAWSEVALDCGYYDQAHFNRDFRAFTGARPRDIVKDADPLTAFFLSVSSKTTGVRGR